MKLAPNRIVRSLALVSASTLIGSALAFAASAAESAPQTPVVEIRDQVAALETHLNQALVGLARAKRVMSQSVNSYLVDRKAGESKPSSVLLYGEEGTGKTTLAKTTAASLGYKFHRLMMADYSADASGERFKADLLAAAKADGQSVIFFDEIEKASPAAQSVLQRVLDDGSLNGDDLSKPLYIAATNAAGFIANQPHAPSVFEVMSEKDGLNPSLRDQFPVYVAVPQPTLENAIEIVKLKTNEMVEKLKKSGINVSLDADVIAKVVVGRLYAQAPRAEIPGSIGFLANIEPRQIPIPPTLSPRTLEREVASIEREIKMSSIKSDRKDIALTLDEASGKLQVTQKRKTLGIAAPRCEPLLSSASK